MSERRQLGLMLAPYVVGALLLFVVPAAYSIALALTDADLLTPSRFVGTANFEELAFDDPIVPGVLWRSALFVVIAVPLRLAVATTLALMLHARARGVHAGRTFAFLPSVIPDAAWAMVWLFLLNPVYGPVNWLLGLLGIAPVSWFSNGTAAFFAIVLMLAFTVGEAFIVALAARQELPRELYAVARLEGARPWFVLRTVTLPLMAPVLTLLAVRDVAVSLQATFTATYLLTDGGPDRATLFLPIYSFDMGFELLRYGYASAMMLLGFLGCLALALAQFGLVRRWRLGVTR
ncbi:sugar ABC transporter permease [Solirubrobacter phytolaccae]|uniref:Sugar ABC transporter permease n=1 Tax=Solirubrobacter phytolaccae TaxID=1404360 RepID=A0A9X3NBL6_9ACTN|nr:sugar ABC transporter permease [Solirubrobacter phytolaccae]MDA0183383.1 sugar ABC transporter permease [Solirubrobacter phytolaccae]